MYKDFHEKINHLNDGTYDVYFHEKRYLLSKQTLLEGKLIKLYAQELGGKDFISLNYYPEIKEGLLRPCEMPVQKVVDFILELRVFCGFPQK